MLGMAIAIHPLAHGEGDRSCESFEYREDRELCQRKRLEAERQQEAVEQRIRHQKNQLILEQQEKMARMKNYRTIMNTLANSATGTVEVGQEALFQIDRELNISSCLKMTDPGSFLKLYRENKLSDIPRGFSVDDYRSVLLNVVLLPQADGTLFSDGSEVKSRLRQLEDYLLTNGREDRSKWNEFYNRLAQSYEHYKATVTSLSGTKISVEGVLPRTIEERQSYRRHLEPLRSYLGHASQWSEIDRAWAKSFFQQQEGSLGRDPCGNFKRKYVDPYQQGVDGIDPLVSNYLWLLMKATYYESCASSTADDQKLVSMHKSALTTTVEQVINRNPLNFMKMNSRQLNIANLASYENKQKLVEELNLVGRCAYDQISWLNAIHPQ